MNTIMNIIGTIIWKLGKAGVFFAAWILSIVITMTSTALLDGFSDIGSNLLGMTTNHSKVKTKSTKLGKKMERRTKRILAVNTLGAAGGWIPIAGDMAAGAFMAYEAVLICENSNDFRDLQRTIGVDPGPSTIGESCEWARDKWESQPQWLRDLVEEEVEEEVKKNETDPVLVYIDDKWVDINAENWWENL